MTQHSRGSRQSQQSSLGGEAGPEEDSWPGDGGFQAEAFSGEEDRPTYSENGIAKRPMSPSSRSTLSTEGGQSVESKRKRNRHVGTTTGTSTVGEEEEVEEEPFSVNYF